MKHALYEITKNIPAPIVSVHSKSNGLAHLVRSLKRGDSALVLFKQVQAAKQAARHAGIELVWQRVGKGTTARIWNIGKLKAKSAKPTTTEPTQPGKKQWTKKSDYWSPENAALRSAAAKKSALHRKENKAAGQPTQPKKTKSKRDYTHRFGSLQALAVE